MVTFSFFTDILKSVDLRLSFFRISTPVNILLFILIVFILPELDLSKIFMSILLQVIFNKSQKFCLEKLVVLTILLLTLFSLLLSTLVK